MKWFARRSTRAVSHGYSLIDEHLAVAGNLATDATVRVEGRIEGTQHRVGKLIVGANATVVGEVEAHEVIVAGTLAGNLTVHGRVEVKHSATVHGDIRAAAVMLEDGGTVHGHLMVHPVDAEAARSATPTLLLTPSRAAAAIPQS